MQTHPDLPVSETIIEDLPFYLARAGIEFRRFNERTLRAVGLDSQAPGMASVLHALQESDNCPVRSLAERTRLPNGTLSGMLDTLEGDGYIQRVRNPDDGRSKCIQLTSKGRQLCSRMRLRHEVVMTLFRQVLSDREEQELKRLLARVTARMRAFVPEEDRPPHEAPAPRERNSSATPRRRVAKKKQSAVS